MLCKRGVTHHIFCISTSSQSVSQSASKSNNLILLSALHVTFGREVERRHSQGGLFLLLLLAVWRFPFARRVSPNFLIIVKLNGND